ncbi:MAG TPA: translocation/assembly module TamB domain-containing protein [Acidobacteriaceae bacterium]|nr:translocation/assembly module TamB domain-containing protein [Acidobacteriaceae bacterium]
MSTSAHPDPAKPRRPVGRVVLLAVFGVILVIAALAGALAWYATTPAFANRVRHAVTARLETATGGRVELRRFTWHLTHLEFTAEDLTIHGREAPDQIPWLHIDRLYVRLQILSFFEPKIALSDLEADHPVFHLIVYADGSTNEPRPRHPSRRSVKDEIFDLEIAHTVVNDGLAILNERKYPFQLSAGNVAARVSYVTSDDHYVASIHAEDVVAQRGNETPVHSVLDAEVDVGRGNARLVSLTLESGPRNRRQKTVVRLTGSLSNFANPYWEFFVKGAVDAREVHALTGAPGLTAGIAQLSATGHGTRSQFTVDGLAGITGGAYREGSVYITGASAATHVHVTQDQIALTGVHAHLASGGALEASFVLSNWLSPGSASPATAGAAPEKGAIRAHLAGFSLDSILDEVAPRRFRRLGFATEATGTANVDWTGHLSSLTGSVNVRLTPPSTPVPHEVPVSGAVNAEYVQRTGMVVIRQFQVRTPASELRMAGTMGVYPFTRPTQITARATTRNLSEFNPILAAFGISAGGEPSPIPAQLQGEAQFHGSVAGSLDSPEFRGHVEATDFEIAPSEQTPSLQALGRIHFDRLTADADYAAGSLAIRAATLVEGRTIIHIDGQVRGNPKKPSDLFAESSAVEAAVQVRNARLAQWIALTGRTYPVSGTLNLAAQAMGTIGDLQGSGRVSLTGGSIDGEPYRSLTGDLQIQGREVNATHLALALDGGQVTGSGGYDFTDRTVQFDIEGSGFELAHIRRVQVEQYPVSGSVSFAARGSGPLESPSLEGTLHVRRLSFAQTATGSVDASARTRNGTLQLQVQANLNTATLTMNSRTQLGGDFETHAQLDVARFNIDPLLKTFSVTGIRGSSEIGAAVTVEGPLRHPKQLSGEASVSELAVTLEDVPLHSQGTLHAILQDGTLRVDPVRIVGPDTDVHAQGSLGLFSTPRPIRMSAGGSVNMALVETLDTDIVSSGRVDFTVNAQGTTKAPDLNGQVKFTNVNVSLDQITNGLSRMNGTLVFDQDRLDFRDVTAYSGGGLIRVGGFATYHHGLYVDLSASADQVRIRYPEGVTSTANAQLRFQGTQASMVLSGHVTLTGFSISPNVDFAAVSSVSTSVALPPNPNSPANRVRLDIRITSAPSLNFQNSFALLAGNVNLAIRGTLAQPTVLGRVTITEGTATFNGAKFELQHGEIYFSNPVRIQPVIDLTATTRVEDYNITIDLQGTPSNLTPTFRSEPPLSEQDIFSLLAMGRTQEEQQIYQNEEQQAGVNSTANALLGGALNASISSRIQKLFGGGSVRIDPTFVSGVGNATARITVTEPVSKQATLTYATNVNSTAEQLIQGEWHLTQNFSILAVRDESGVFSLIFRLHRRYP